MQRILLIAFAVIAVLVVWMGLGWLARRRRAGTAGLPAGGIPVSNRLFWAALAGLAVLLAGLLMLEVNSSSPDGKYQPARLEEGKIQPPVFESDRK